MTDTKFKLRHILHRIKTRYIIRKQQRRHDGEGNNWMTVNGTRIELEPGESPEEAGKRFSSEKKAESAAYSPEVLELLGTEHKGVKGSAAIARLLEERNGHVKNAFNREGVGSIDFVWGNDALGLQHIIKRRNEQGFEGESFLSEIPRVIRQGRIRKQPGGTFAIEHGGVRAVIATNLRGNKITFLLTAFELE